MVGSTEYAVGNYEFKIEDFFPINIMNKITDVRVDEPEVIKQYAQNRKRRQKIAPDGKLTILAADHPARRITKSGDDPLLMGNRQEYLGRVLRVITSPDCDGVMATTDIIEDLFIVSYLVHEQGGPDFLAEKVILGCMNRGGLGGCTFEMDDTFTSFTADSISTLSLDGAKMMFRLEVNSYDSAKTITACAHAVNSLNELGIPAFIEPLAVVKTESGYKNVKTAADQIKMNGIASALGDSSLGIWLKIPYCEDFPLVVKSTACPILILGGESLGNPVPVLNDFADGMKAGKNVRGALVGRNVLFPGKDDPAAVAAAVYKIVHEGLDANNAVAYLQSVRGRESDVLKKHFA